MTEVCIVGAPDQNLRADLLAYETARSALSAYDVREPWENAVAVGTVSLGMAVSLLGDLSWYLSRVAEAALVREPSVDGTEWLSRDLARAIRNEDTKASDAADRLKVYGVVDGTLVEPMFVTRGEDGSIPEYDLREVEDSVVVRVTKSEFR